MNEKKYDAFISYRHLPLDMAAAKRLQELLERIKPPLGLECKNTNRISRIFRDESELPTSGDLGQDIKNALDNSSFLIVLCSPKLKESKWCMEEIRHFKQRNGGRINRILPILIDGDPAVVFPEEIRYDLRKTLNEDGVEQEEIVEVEPLACNIVAGSIKESVKKLNIEFLRIAAPILGCSFDDLYRRHHRRKIRRMITAGIAACGLTVLFAATVVIQNTRVQNQRYRTLAENAVNAMHEGDIPQAVQLALQALPGDGLFSPPVLPQAQKALADALGVYDLSDGYRPHRNFTLPAKALQVALSEDGKTGAAVYAHNVAVFDTETGKVTATLPTARSMLCEAHFINNNVLIYAGENGLTAFDTASNTTLWTGGMATAIAISADKSTIAAVYLEENEAAVYDASGVPITRVSFSGRKQRVAAHDMLGNPMDNLFSLNKNGSFLAVSFSDGSLTVFDIAQDNSYSILNTTDFISFEGGFSDNYFAFSASEVSGYSVMAVVDMDGFTQVEEFERMRKLGVVADESGVYVSNVNLVIKLDALEGDRPLARTEADVYRFATYDGYTVVTTHDNSYEVFDAYGRALQKHTGGAALSDLVALRGDYALVAGQDSPVVRILKRADNTLNDLFSYEPDYFHMEARVNTMRTRVMLFSYQGFRLYDINGQLINEVVMPDAERVFNQRYYPENGNLAVIYRDALRVYSGEDGNLMLEMTDVKSVFYAPYGISVFNKNNTLHVLDPATKIGDIYPASGEFAAWVGMVIDSAFLNGDELIGAAQSGTGYWFATSDGIRGKVYDGTGKMRFEIDTGAYCEAYFTDDYIFVYPFNGTPVAYRLKTGKKAAELERDAYLTYITPMGDTIISEYINANGERFGLLLDKNNLQPIALLPKLADINGDSLIFNYNNVGILRESPAYSIHALKSMAETKK